MIDLEIKGDHRGSLVALEENLEVPFKIKRVFYIFDTQNNVIRGEHAHLKTRQFLIPVSGRCTVELYDGINTKVYDLDRPDIGLFQDAMVWGKMYNFSNDCVLLVLADRLYEESDYIRQLSLFENKLNNYN